MYRGGFRRGKAHVMTSFKAHVFVMSLLGVVAFMSGCALFPDSREKAYREIIRKNLEKQESQNLGNKEPTEPNYSDLAKELIKNGHYEVALVQLQKALEANQKAPEVYHLMGVCYRELEDYGKAIESFSRAIRMDEDFSFGYDGLGMTYALMAQKEKARTLFVKAVSLNPARADFYNNLGFLEMESGRHDKAEHCFRKSLAVNPDFHRARNNLAICLGLSGRDREAMAMLDRNYPRAVALRNMGVIYHMKGDEEKASAMFREAEAAQAGTEKIREAENKDQSLPGRVPDRNDNEKQAAIEEQPGQAGPGASEKGFVDIKDWIAVEVEHWAIVDEGEEQGPSSWYISDELLKQRSNICGGSDLRDIPDKPGTYAVAGESHWADYCLDVRLVSNDDDALGVIFRYLDQDNYYRFSMDRSRAYRRLVKKTNGIVHVLAEENEGYEKGQSYRVRAVAVEDRLRIFLDEELLFDVRDRSISRGKVGLYCWANRGSQFQYPVVRLHPGEKPSNLDTDIPAFTQSIFNKEK
jgi:Flp pilus assembly protein TadD